MSESTERPEMTMGAASSHMEPAGEVSRYNTEYGNQNIQVRDTVGVIFLGLLSIILLISLLLSNNRNRRLNKRLADVGCEDCCC